MQNSALPSKDFYEKRLERACKHVTDLWFPANPELLRRIRQGLQDGSYDLDLGFLINEVKSDFALYTYCLKEISRLMREEKLSPPENATPSQLFQFAGLDTLKEILYVSETTVSKHSLGSINDLQSGRMQEAIISASSAEVFCKAHKIDPELGFSAACLRQLGLTLIAWNYPTVYRRVITSLSKNQHLETELAKILGFSPSLLAVTLIKQWGLTAALEEVVSKPLDESDERISLDVMASRLERICKIGEALARANDPEHYPSAVNDWVFAKGEVQKALGHEGINLIQERVRDFADNYLMILPQSFSASLDVNPEGKLLNGNERRLLENNPYVEHLFPELKLRFNELYTQLNPASISKDNLRFLLKTIVPLAGFSGVCVYTLDPGTSSLIPHLKMGKLELKTPEPLEFNSRASSSDPIVTAFKLESLISEEVDLLDKEPLTYFATSFGAPDHVGVLYLEAPSAVAENQNFNLTLHVKAIRQALNDSLNFFQVEGP